MFLFYFILFHFFFLFESFCDNLSFLFHSIGVLSSFIPSLCSPSRRTPRKEENENEIRIQKSRDRKSVV